MSVLIQDMKMPKGCAFCPILSHQFCYAAKVFIEKPFMINRHERCPLVELPSLRYGRWYADVKSDIGGLRGVRGFRCSACEVFCITKSNYCPNCGARMGGAE